MNKAKKRLTDIISVEERLLMRVIGLDSYFILGQGLSAVIIRFFCFIFRVLQLAELVAPL